MHCKSTRYFLDTTNHVFDNTGVSFTDAVFEGLALDGGLYYPSSIIDLSQIILSLPHDISFVDLCIKITYGLFSDEFSMEEVEKICKRAFSFSPIVSPINDEIILLELFHGPSCAFKDFGAAYLASVMDLHLSKTRSHTTILTATSGDTGGAVAQAFFRKENIRVFILYPSGRVSPLQEKQLTGLGGNIIALEVDGSFDDCQRMVKKIFADEELRSKTLLTSANSINIGRLIPQSFYYIYAWNMLRRRCGDDILFFCAKW